MHPRLSNSEIEEIKQRFTIFDAYKTLGFEGKPKPSMKSPFREDHNASFSIFNNGQFWKDHTTGEKGDVVDFIAKATNLSRSQAFIRFLQLAGYDQTSRINHHTQSTLKTIPDKLKLTNIYPYHNITGALEYQILRYEDNDHKKTFKARRPDKQNPGKWIYDLSGCVPLLYNLPNIQEAINNNAIICIVEGEKDVETLKRNGFVGTCNHGGALKWRSEFDQFFHNARVVVIPDNDLPGNQHAQMIVNNLHPVVQDIKLLTLPELPPKGDVSDWLLTHSADDLQMQINSLFRTNSTYPPEIIEVLKKLDLIHNSLEKISQIMS